jgi:putative heme-binding domain-containing protein
MQLESYHGTPKQGAIAFAWQHLKNPDRHIRYAARIAVEAQPLSEWTDKTLKETDPVILTNAAIGLARRGDAAVKKQLLTALTKINLSPLTESQKLDHLRAIELVFARMGAPDAAEKTMVANQLNPFYPAATNDLNKELSKLLVYVEAPKAVEKTMALLATAKDGAGSIKTLSESSDLILRNPQYGIDIAGMLSKMPPLTQTWYANVLSQAKTGWTPVCYVGFIDKARTNALAHVPKESFAQYNKISGDDIVKQVNRGLDPSTKPPKGPGRNWKLEEALLAIDTAKGQRDFEDGKAMFAASLCKSCHQVKGEGGISGPDLTQLGTRFSNKDMLEAIISPSKAISDQYGSTVFFLKKGGSILGRLIRQDNTNYYISQNPFDATVVRTVAKSNVARTRVSDVSPMLPGMINGLNPEELNNLIAYLKSGGNPNHPVYTASK